MSEKIAEPPKGASLRNRVGLTLAAGATVGAGFLGVDNGTKTVEAVGTTPTPISTPDVREQRIIALQTVVAKAAKEREQDQIIANLQATATALRETPTKIATPIPAPTRSSVEATATADAKRLEALGREQAVIKATATARAEQTATAEARTAATATVIPGKGNRDTEQGGGLSSFIVFLLVSGLGIGGTVVATQTERGRNSVRWVRGTAVNLWRRRPRWLGGGTPPAGGPAGGGGTP